MTQKESPERPERTYLGDGAYASFDGYQVWIETDNGIEITNRVALEKETFEALLQFVGLIWFKETMN